MDDYMLRVWSKEMGLRGLACTTTALAREAAHRHHTTPLATAALAYGLTAAALLGALLKVQQRVALKVEANGPLGKLVAEADAYGRVRGYVAKPDVPSPPIVGPAEVAEALGRQGLLTVAKDLRLRDLYQGTIALESGELGKDLALYLEQSEQIPSLVEIGVQMDESGQLVAAGGLLVQTLPGFTEEALHQVYRNMEALPPLATLLADGLTPEDIMADTLKLISYQVLEQRPLAFACSCSRERSRQALKILGEDEVLALILEGEAVVDCHFCHESYVFDRDELEKILDELESEALQAMFGEEGEQPVAD